MKNLTYLVLFIIGFIKHVKFKKLNIANILISYYSNFILLSNMTTYSSKRVNLLRLTDIYKLGHIEQFPKSTTKVYSYLEARGSTELDGLIFFGLQYILKEYLMRPVLQEDLTDFIMYYKMARGREPTDFIVQKLQALVNLGYLPIEIKALPEGTYIGLKHIIMSITNTLDDFYWLPGYLEVILLKVWSTITTATRMFQYKKLAYNFWNQTTSNTKFYDYIYSIIDFGTRGNSSEESAELHSMAFMTCFSGSDCLPVIEPSIKYYNVLPCDPNFMRTSPATEHSVMCAYGRTNELDAFKRMFELYPDEPVCIVSDTYNLWNVFTDYMIELKSTIEERKCFTAFRPDSGNPTLIVLGNKKAVEGTPEYVGCLQLLDNVFGHTLNTKGFKVLNHVKIMYGDGITLQCYEEILRGCVNVGFSVENISFGVGSIMYKNTRDTLGFAFKAVAVIVNGEERHICKDPITDQGKKSKKGYIKLVRHDDGSFETIDKLTQQEELDTWLPTVYKDGVLLIDQSLYEIQARVNSLFVHDTLEKIDGIVCLIGNDCTGKTTLCKALYDKFTRGESRILPIERSVNYVNDITLHEIKKRVNPSYMDDVLHLCSFEKRPNISTTIEYCSKVMQVYYIIIDAPIDVLKYRSSQRSERDKYESEKAFQYYRNKYMEMSIYYGFPIVLNDGTLNVDDVVDNIFSKLASYSDYHELRIENITNITKNLSENRNHYDNICNYDESFKMTHIKMRCGVISKFDSQSLQLVESECCMRNGETNLYGYVVDNLAINILMSGNNEPDICQAMQKCVSKYLGDIVVDNYNSKNLTIQLRNFMTKHKFHEYDLSEEHINEL